MFDFGPGKSPGLSRNKPQRREPTTKSIHKWLCLWDSNPGTYPHNCVIPFPPPPLHPPLPSPQAILCGEQLSFFFLLQVLFRHVLLGEITVDRLVRMTPEQLASPELATWREQETKHVSFLFSAVLISTMQIL